MCLGFGFSASSAPQRGCILKLCCRGRWRATHCPASTCLLLRPSFHCTGKTGASCQLAPCSHFCPELSLPLCLCAIKCQRYCLLFCALYSCFTHFCLWASLFPEVSDLESQQDKINSNDLGLGISVWPWLCHLLTVRLLPSIIKWE